jgi:hypothetical protein
MSFHYGRNAICCDECGEPIKSKDQRCWETGGTCSSSQQRKDEEIVSYKGKKYRLLWQGKTKWGQKAKLGFLNGSQEFWVDTVKLN